MKMETIRACSIWRALEVVGDVPVLLIMERAFLGVRHFEEFVDQTALARSVVSNRLKKLVEEDCLEKKKPARGKRFEYLLTDKGRELFSVALMMLRWQHKWEPEKRRFRVELVHQACGHAIEPVPSCAHCTAEIDPRSVRWAEGPGLAQVVPAYNRRRKQTRAAADKRAGLALIDTLIELFGDRWATLVVRACFTGIYRFDEIQRDTLMATNILSDRLTRLTEQGIIKAIPYMTNPDRYEYRLTAKGRDLYPVLLGLLQWGDKWYADDKGPPLLLHHESCDQPLKMKVTCSGCDDTLTIRNIQYKIVDSR